MVKTENMTIPSYREGNDLNFALQVSRNGEPLDLSEAFGLSVTVRHISNPSATLSTSGLYVDGNTVGFTIIGTGTVNKPTGRYVVALKFSVPAQDGERMREFVSDAQLFDLVRHSWEQRA